MSKDKQFDELFEHLFQEAVSESYQLASKLTNLTLKLSWESLLKKIEEQRQTTN